MRIPYLRRVRVQEYLGPGLVVELDVELSDVPGPGEVDEGVAEVGFVL